MGVMGDLGIHKTDLIQYLLDDQIVEVTAEFSTLDMKMERRLMWKIRRSAFIR